MVVARGCGPNVDLDRTGATAASSAIATRQDESLNIRLSSVCGGKCLANERRCVTTLCCIVDAFVLDRRRWVDGRRRLEPGVGDCERAGQKANPISHQYH